MNAPQNSNLSDAQALFSWWGKTRWSRGNGDPHVVVHWLEMEWGRNFKVIPTTSRHQREERSGWWHADKQQGGQGGSSRKFLPKKCLQISFSLQRLYKIVMEIDQFSLYQLSVDTHTIVSFPKSSFLISVTNELTALYGLWNPDVQSRFHKDSPMIPTLSRINPIPHIATYFFKIHSNIAPSL